jgi:hypothetical protein
MERTTLRCQLQGRQMDQCIMGEIHSREEVTPADPLRSVLKIKISTIRTVHVQYVQVIITVLVQ